MKTFKKIVYSAVLIFVWLFIFIVIPLSVNCLGRSYGLMLNLGLAGKIAGIILFSGGIIIHLYSSSLFILFGKGTPIPSDPPKKFVAKGLYQYVRNPMYLAYFIVLFAYFLFFGNLIHLAYFLAAVLVLVLYVIFIEEPELKKRFGEEYEDYLKTVPCWLPKLKKGNG